MHEDFIMPSRGIAIFIHPNPSWLTSGRTSGQQKLVPTFPWMDNCLMVTKR